MTLTELQQWLGAHGQPVLVDGLGGPQTRAAIVAAFTNTCAEAVTDADIEAIASRLGCTPKQVKAVAKVESGRSAFDDEGRPKMLFERHKYWRLTNGRFPVTEWNDPVSGGYGKPSWPKLLRAACQDVDAAFSAASWGRFQVLGMHWQGLNYPSPLELAYSTVTSEAAHYELLARYIERFNLTFALRALSTNPADNERFAAAYNGPTFRKFNYHNELAEAMA